MSEEKKVLLSLKDVEVKFNVRGRILTAIRRVSLDIYEHESLAIVGESGSGKSVLTKTFAGMLDSNGFISNGTIIFSDDDISRTDIELTPENTKLLGQLTEMVNRHSKLERGAASYNAYLAKKEEITHAQTLTLDEEADYNSRIRKLSDRIVDVKNYMQVLDRKNAEDQAQLAKSGEEIQKLTAERDALSAEMETVTKT